MLQVREESLPHPCESKRDREREREREREGERRVSVYEEAPGFRLGTRVNARQNKSLYVRHEALDARCSSLSDMRTRRVRITFTEPSPLKIQLHGRTRTPNMKGRCEKRVKRRRILTRAFSPGLTLVHLLA